MLKILVVFSFITLVFSCSSSSQGRGYLVETKLPKQLKEISGIIAVGNYIWAISDKPSPVFFKLDKEGKLLQQVRFQKLAVSDAEAITADDKYLYIGDVGDNDGNRKVRTIIRVAFAGIGSGKNVVVGGETIKFSFPEDITVEKKKKNDYDCESLLSFNDSLYLFTKRRSDDLSELFVIPKKPGNHVARHISTLEVGGLITDAAINESKNEVALTGYQKGHDEPFILFIKNFTGNDFFSGKLERVQLGKKNKEWQVEGITYKGDSQVYFACEATKDVPATLYSQSRNNFKIVSKKE